MIDGLRIVNRRTKRVIFVILTISFSVSISLVVAEVILRIMGVGYGNAPLESDPLLHHAHPASYTYISHVPTGEYGGHTVYYDEEGLVSDRESTYDWPNSPCFKIAFMGDSFTEANQVAFSDSFVGRLKKSSEGKVIVRNYGVSSYSPIFYLIQWREKVRNINPTHVIVELYSNDISSDEQFSREAVYSNNGKLLAISGPEGGWFNKLLRKSYLIRLVRKVQLQIVWILNNSGKTISAMGGFAEENPDLSEMSKKLILILAEEVKSSGAHFALMVVPSKYRLVNEIFDSPDDQFSDKLKKWAETVSIDFIDLVRPFEEANKGGKQLFFDQDIHFTEEGHVIVAKAISEKYPDFDPAE